MLVMADEAAKNPYISPQVASWLDYLEGIPEPVYPSPLESSAEPAARSPWQNFLNQKFDQLGLVLPGQALLLAIIARARLVIVPVVLLRFLQGPGGDYRTSADINAAGQVVGSNTYHVPDETCSPDNPYYPNCDDTAHDETRAVLSENGVGTEKANCRPIC
jgi:hypothetical protein